MNDRILITGSAGFIGSHLAAELLKSGCHVAGIDSLNDYYPVAIKQARLKELEQYKDRFVQHNVDLCDRDRLDQIFTEFEPRYICNLAAQAGVRYSLKNPSAYQKSNLEGFLNLLECCRKFDIERLVYASSSSVYGGNERLPFSESDRVDTPISLYAATKKANELLAHSYSHLFDIQTVGLRFFTVYGPWGRPDMAMWIFAEKILNDDPIPVFNNGNMQRDFTYIDDIVNGTVNAIFGEELGRYSIFNLGNHRSEQLKEMIVELEQALGKKATCEYLPIQPGDVQATFADISRAQASLGFTPKTPISEGIPRFCRWYLDHPDLARVAREWRKNEQ